jgi:O-antigen ligase
MSSAQTWQGGPAALSRRAHGELAGWWPAAALLVLVFAMGGGSRADIASLPILRPLTVLLLAYGLYRLPREALIKFRWLFAFAVATVGLVAAQLVPLPPSLWQLLPGREVVAEIGAAAGGGQPWRPISLAPSQTLNALWSLAAPLAMLVLLAPLRSAARQRLASVIVAIAGISVFIALMQTLGGGRSLFYFYRITNSDAPVGLFANRNHQAVFLAAMLPILAVWASAAEHTAEGRRPRKKFQPQTAIAVALVILIVPLLFVGGSRSGLLLAGLAAASVPFVIIAKRGGRSARPVAARAIDRRWLFAAGAVAVAALAGVATWLGRASTIDRFTQPGEELRVQALPTLLEMTGTYFPFGIGYGAFDPAFRMHEPIGMLAPDYFNHAHNDWLETVLTGGLPAALLLTAAAVAVIGRTWALWRAGPPADFHAGLARAGAMAMIILGLASITDYPLRTPALACLFVVCAVWATSGGVAGRRPGAAR